MFSKGQFDWCSVSIGHEIELHCFIVLESTCQDGIAGCLARNTEKNITCFEMVKTSVASSALCHFKGTCVFLYETPF